MPSTDDLRKAFRSALELPDGEIVDSLTYRSIEAWDSVAHMVLVSEIEDVFDVMLETQEVIDMSSFAKAVDLLDKHGVSLD